VSTYSLLIRPFRDQNQFLANTELGQRQPSRLFAEQLLKNLLPKCYLPGYHPPPPPQRVYPDDTVYRVTEMYPECFECFTASLKNDLIKQIFFAKPSQLRRCGRRRSGLPARLIVTLFDILCGANLKYGSLQSLATKPRI
jgi:hypothetical protein